jgi:hypothetical protein
MDTIEWYGWQSMKWKGFRRKLPWPNRDAILAFPCRNWGKSLNVSVSITGVTVNIRTEDLLDTNLDRYHYSSLHGNYFVHLYNWKICACSWYFHIPIRSCRNMLSHSCEWTWRLLWISSWMRCHVQSRADLQFFYQNALKFEFTASYL